MANPQLSVRLPEGLMQQLDTAATVTGNKSELVISILDAYFNPAPEDEVGQLRRRLEEVEQRLAVLDE